MIKKVLFASLMMLGLFSVSSCKDDDNASENNQGEKGQTEEMADYTVIFWGMAGGNDAATANDLYACLVYRENGRIGANVNVVGTLKTSMSYAYGSEYDSFDKTLTFDLDKKSGCTIPMDDQAVYKELTGMEGGTDEAIEALEEEMTVYKYKTLFENITVKEVGDTLYDIQSVEKLAAFIRNAAETHPAKHYVLMTYGHGNGFNLDADVRTRGCVIDEYSNRELSAQDLADAVKQSGVHIQTLFCQNCLMSTLENLPYFQQVADYAIISSEVTYSNYLQQYIANISAAGDDLEKMKKASRDVIDFYVNLLEPHVDKLRSSTSHGFYDLSQTGALMSVVKKITDWYTDAADKDPEFVAKVIDNTIYTSCPIHSAQQIDYVSLRQTLLDIYLPETFSIWSQKQVIAFVDVMTVMMDLQMTGGFIFSDIMRQSLRLKSETDKNLNFDTLANLYEEYINTLKSMAYIRAVQADDTIVDYAYIYTSPSVCIVPFNNLYKKAGYAKEEHDKICSSFIEAFGSGDVEKVNDVFCYYFDGVGYNSDMATMLQGYQNTLFDQQTGWSGFLKKLPTIPNCLTNPDRIDYITGLRKY